MMVLGGNDGKSYQKSTYFIDLETLQVKPGPEMQEERLAFGCAVFEHNQQRFVIAAGGLYSINSTEFLNLSSKIWSRGRTNQALSRNSKLQNISYSILIKSIFL